MWTITEKEILLDNKSVKTFGISGKSVEISDVSTHKEEVEEFVELLNKLNASEIHAYELVEDFMER